MAKLGKKQWMITAVTVCTGTLAAIFATQMMNGHHPGGNVSSGNQSHHQSHQKSKDKSPDTSTDKIIRVPLKTTFIFKNLK